MKQDFNIIAEKLDLGFDLHKLRASLDELQKSIEPAVRVPQYTGWSLQSPSGGSYKDGWSYDFVPYNGPLNKSPTWTPETPDEKKLFTIQDFQHFTVAATEPFQSLIHRLDEFGLNPRRSRIICLAPGAHMRWHRDGLEGHYQVRIHIPLYTNQDCFFETDHGRYHMEADGSAYFVHTNLFHRAYNRGSTPRYHFVALVWDQKRITKHHQYNPDEFVGETTHGKGTWFREVAAEGVK